MGIFGMSKPKLSGKKKEQSVSKLTKALKHKDINVRRSAAIALGEKAYSSIVTIAFLTSTSLSNDPSRYRIDTEVAEKVLSGVDGLKVQDFLETYLQALKEDDEDIRMGVGLVLGLTGDKRALEPLIYALKNQDSRFRLAAASILEMIGDEKAIEPLKNALQDEDTDVRLVAKRALKKLTG
jgi:hypothetical protein